MKLIVLVGLFIAVLVAAYQIYMIWMFNLIKSLTNKPDTRTPAKVLRISNHPDFKRRKNRW